MDAIDPNGTSYQAAIEFLKSYGAPDATFVAHSVDTILAEAPWMKASGPTARQVDVELATQMFALQDSAVATIVDQYRDQTIPDYQKNAAGSTTPVSIPPIPDLPGLLPDLQEAHFGNFTLPARVVIECPPLALRMLRRAFVVPGDTQEIVPFPRVTAPADNRVIIVDPARTRYFLAGPGDNFPAGYIYTLDGVRYRKDVWGFMGTFWERLP